MGFGRGDAGRIGMLMALMLQSAALATIATSALGFTEWHWLFKPLAMIFALVLVVASAYSTSVRGPLDSKLASAGFALAGSLAGMCSLMFQGFFIPGLVSFLVAHLFYVALFKRGQVWFPHRGAGCHVGHWRGHVHAFCGRETCPLPAQLAALSCW